MRYLKLTLAGVLQSYGNNRSPWSEYYDTELLPTLSAVAGIIGCACGIERGDKKLEDIKALDMQCVTVKKPHKIADYQIVSPKEPDMSREDSSFWNVNGSHTGSQLPIVKTYLADGEFNVYVGSDNEKELEHIYNAFLHPKWQVYLGRKCCPPGKPIIEREFKLYDIEDFISKGAVPCISV